MKRQSIDDCFIAVVFPDLMEFDAKTGMVKFKGDVTFASGDATLTPRAKLLVRAKVSVLRWIFAVVIVVLGAEMIYNGITGRL